MRRGGGDDGDEEEEVQFGVRRSRRQTSWQHRETSSLSQAEMVERDFYMQFAEDRTQRYLQFLPIISSLFITLSRYYTMIGHWQSNY